MSDTSDSAKLERALAAIAASVPDGLRAKLATSDQGFYGFVLADVELTDGTLLSARDPELFDQLTYDLCDDLCDLAWDGAVGEDRYGYATIDLPPA